MGLPEWSTIGIASKVSNFVAKVNINVQIITQTGRLFSYI